MPCYHIQLRTLGHSSHRQDDLVSTHAHQITLKHACTIMLAPARQRKLGWEADAWMTYEEGTAACAMRRMADGAGTTELTPEQKLQSAREEWRAGLDDVLDSDADLQRLCTRADDLKVELIRIQTPPDPTWPVHSLFQTLAHICCLCATRHMLLLISSHHSSFQ